MEGEDRLIEFEGFNNYPAARIRAFDCEVKGDRPELRLLLQQT